MLESAENNISFSKKIILTIVDTLSTLIVLKQRFPSFFG